MRVFIIINCLVYVSYARPEFGYNYQRPDTGQIGFTGFTGQTGGTGYIGQIADGGYTGQTGGTGFIGQTGSTSFTGHTGGIGFTGHSGGIGVTGGTGLIGQTGSTSITGHTGGIGITGPTAGVVDGGVHRHVYVYTAPHEEEVFQQKVTSTGAAQKHYKIIFIKTPSYSTSYQQTLAAQAQNQEKTIIYVLAKRPDEPGDISLPTVAPTAPSKPEVYFIRYKSQKEAVQQGGVTHDGPIGGVNTGFDTTGNTGFVTTGVTNVQTKYGPPEKIGY